MGLLSVGMNILSGMLNGSDGTANAKVTQAMNLEWLSPAAFVLDMFDRPTVTSTDDFIEYNAAGSKYSFTGIGTDLLNMHLTKASVTSLEATPIEFWNGGMWSYTTGRPTTRQLTLTFYDSNNGTTDNSLYKKFLANYWYLHNLYPNEQKWKIRIVNNTGFYERGKSLSVLDTALSNATPLISSKNAILQTVGELKYSQSSKDIMTFDVIFKFYEAL